MLDIDIVRKLCKAATPGPWHASEAGEDPIAIDGPTKDPYDHVISAWPVGGNNSRLSVTAADVAFICAARTLVPELIAEVERLRKEVDASERNLLNVLLEK